MEVSGGECNEEEHAGQQVGKFVADAKFEDGRDTSDTVVEQGDGGDSEKGSWDVTFPAEDGGASQHHGGDGCELVAGSCVGTGLVQS
jgi:hypothetical protein